VTRTSVADFFQGDHSQEWAMFVEKFGLVIFSEIVFVDGISGVVGVSADGMFAPVTFMNVLLIFNNIIILYSDQNIYNRSSPRPRKNPLYV
jgi:hypothetical protein